MPILPIAAQQAGDDPVSAAKIAHAPRLASTNPPGSRYSQRSSASYRSLPAGDDPIAAPIITNIGIDTSVKSLRPAKNVSATTCRAPKPWKIAMKMIDSMPRPNATGAPESSTSSVTTSTIAPCVDALIGMRARLRVGIARSRSFAMALDRDAERRLAPGHEQKEFNEVLQRDEPEADRHRGIRYPQAHPPHGVREPMLVPRLEPIQRREDRKDDAERHRKKHRGDGEPEARACGQINRQHIDIDVSAEHEHVRRADERRRDETVGDEVGLPDRVLVEDEPNEHHLADDTDADGNQRRSHVAAEPRYVPNAPGKSVHAVLSGARRQIGGASRRAAVDGRRTERAPSSACRIGEALFDAQGLVDE